MTTLREVDFVRIAEAPAAVEETNLPRARLVVMVLLWWLTGLDSSSAEVQKAGTAARDEIGACLDGPGSASDGDP